MNTSITKHEECAPAREGCMKNALGQDVPLRLVKDVDLLRNDLVMDLVARFERVSAEIRALKDHSTNELEAFLKISAERFGQDLGGKKAM